MTFRILGLDRRSIAPLLTLSDEALRRAGAQRMVADSHPGFPCRVTLEDAQPGEEVILLNHRHLPHATPYQAQGPIFVRTRLSAERFESVDAVPQQLASRLLSVRAYDDAGMMLDADVADGKDAAALFERLLDNPSASFLHVHFARRGCYAALVERA